MNSIRSSSLLASLLFVLAACGGSGGGGGGTEASSSGGESGHHHGGHAQVPEIDALHQELAPVFHSDAGAARAAAACEHANALRERSAAVHAVTAPEGVDAAAWGSATTQLVTSADALGNECAAGGSEVETRLSSLHDAFHAVMELSMGQMHGEGHEHCEHCEHGGEHADCPCHHDGEHAEHADCPCHHDGEHAEHADCPCHHDGEHGEHHDDVHHDDEHHADEHHDDVHHGDAEGHHDDEHHGDEHHDDVHHGEHPTASPDAGAPHS